MPDNEKPQGGARGRKNDPLDDAIKHAMGVEPGSGDDEAHGAAEDASEQQAKDEARGRILADLEKAVQALKVGSSEGVERILRHAINGGLTKAQIGSLIDAIAKTTKLRKADLEQDLKDLAAEIKKAEQKRRREEAERQQSAAAGKAAIHPDIVRAAAEYPLPLSGTSYDIHDGRVWAGRYEDDAHGRRVFKPLHTPFSLDGQIYYPPNDIEGLRISVMSSKKVRASVYVRLGRLQDTRGATEAMSAMADAGLRVTKKGREAILELLSTSFHTTIIAGIERPGFHWVGGKRRYVASHGGLDDLSKRKTTSQGTQGSGQGARQSGGGRGNGQTSKEKDKKP